MSYLGDEEEEEEEQFFESLDRILSLSSSSSTSSSDNDEEGDCRRRIRSPFPDYAPSPLASSSTADAIPSMAVSMYHVWITEPASVEERRIRLLCQMGLSGDKTLSRLKSDDGISREGEMKRSISFCDDHQHLLQANGHTCSSVSSFSSRSRSRPRSDSAADDSRSSSAKNHCNSSSFRPQIHSIQSDIAINPHHVNNTAHTPLLSKHSTNNGLLATNNKPPIGKFSRRVGAAAEEIKPDSMNSPIVPTMADDNLDGTTLVFDDNPSQGRLCTIKNLDNGKEFVVNEFGEDGMWNKLREVGTGRQLTREEFEMCVGHSPLVQELMRRQNVEESSRKKDDLDYSGNSGGSRSKKKGGWFKSIKNVASTVTGQRERRSSDERETSSEKGGRRSSSATDDSQDVLFHMPQKTKVRQYGKSCKELTALYMSQEIRAHNGSIWTIKFSSDGCYLASAGEDRLIHIWQVVESKRNGELFNEKLEDGNSNPFFAINGSPEPALVSSNMENHFEKKRRKVSYSRKSMNLDHVQLPENIFALSEKPFCSFQGHLADVLDLSWSKSQFQYLLSSSMDKTVRLWDIFRNSCLKVFSHSDYVTCIQFNPVNDDYFISGSLDAKVRIWSIQDRQVVDWNDLHEMVTAACYTPDGQGALVGTHKGNCCLYNTSDNKLHQKSQIDLQNKKNKSHVKKITGFQFAPGSSSEVLVTSADSRIRVVDGVDLVHKFKGPSFRVVARAVALEPRILRLQAKSNASIKDATAFFGVSLSDHLKSDFSPLVLKGKRDLNQRKTANGVRAQATITTPAIIKAAPEGKKTLRKGNVIITGASSGLGLATAKALAETGKWHVIMGCRDFLKAERAAKSVGMSKENYTIMHLDLASLDSVRQFVDNFERSGMPLDVLVCNAAVYLPTAKEPTFTAEGFELSVGTNHLGHFLLSRLLLDDMKKSDYPSKRLIIVGSITGNTNTLAGNVPPKANLGDLRGLSGGLNGLNSSTMIDGGDFDGAKAYKDSKVCNMLTMQEFHRRYHEETGIAFASLYPGCIATTGLFREHIPLFRLLFPPFQKYITKGFVSEEEAGKRLAQVVSNPSLTKSGVYWSWNKESASFENKLSQEASDAEKARKVWEISEKLVGLA